MKKVFAIIAAALLTLSASAQDVFYPGFYLGAQAGVNYTTSNQWGLKPLEHLNYPNIQLTAGYDITPVFGLRLALSGLYGNYPTPVDNTIVGVFNYAQAALDATFDICNIFRYRSNRLLNPYIFLGAGGNYRFAANDQPNLLGVAIRGGAGFDIRLNDLIDLTLECQDNNMFDKFNTLADREGQGYPFDQNIAALIGLKFNIGAHKARKAAAIVAAEAAAAAEAARLAAEEAARKEAARLAKEKAEQERLAAQKAAEEARIAAEKAAAEKAAAARAAARAAEENVYFTIGNSNIRKAETSKLDHIIGVLWQYPEATVTICGYADKETGTPKSNMKLSEKRAENVAKALKAAGIEDSRINVKFFGDTEKVSDKREENRVAVIVTK